MNASSVFELFTQYMNDHVLLGLIFLLALAYYLRKAFRINRQSGLAALAALLFLGITVFNPLLYRRLSPIADSGSSYYRFLWMIPLVPLSACFLTEVIGKLICFAVSGCRPALAKPLSYGLGVLLSGVLCAALFFSGTTYLTAENLQIPENKFTISRAALDISQFIHDDPDHADGDVILAPTELMIELEAYDLSLVPALDRNEYLAYGTGESVYEPLLSLVLEGAQRNTEYMTWNLYSLKVDYIAALTLFQLDDYLEDLHYTVYNRTGDYTLYKRTE